MDMSCVDEKIAISKPIKIIKNKFLSGSIVDQINNEIPKIPLLKNEVVYVWGKEKNKMLLERGY